METLNAPPLQPEGDSAGSQHIRRTLYGVAVELSAPGLGSLPVGTGVAPFGIDLMVRAVPTRETINPLGTSSTSLTSHTTTATLVGNRGDTAPDTSTSTDKIDS